MAFRDLELILYDGTIKINYLDKAHRYFRSDLQTDGSWGKKISVKGVTTIMDNVLEKKGLMTWPMGLALRELFGFYDFKNESGEQMTGYSKGVGTIWDLTGNIDTVDIIDPDNPEFLQLIISASKAWQRKKKLGADVGSIVHDKIEQLTTNSTPVGFVSITLEEYKAAQEFENAEQEAGWDLKAPEEVAMANRALEQFVTWWLTAKPKLIGAEALVYSREGQYCGTFDALLMIGDKRYLVDYKTSNASKSRDAAAPQGVYYSYLIQSAAYAMAWEEMGNDPVDDIMIVSVRKDGEFDVVTGTDLGIDVRECTEAWKATAILNRFITKSKTALLNNVNVKEK